MDTKTEFFYIPSKTFLVRIFPTLLLAQERVLLNHQRIARAVARTDTQLQEQMSQASSSLQGVDSKTEGIQRQAAAGVTGKAERNRDLAIMIASDAPKVRRLVVTLVFVPGI